jgi:hypothetical protein
VWHSLLRINLAAANPNISIACHVTPLLMGAVGTMMMALLIGQTYSR